jgi:hypothetical protein
MTTTGYLMWVTTSKMSVESTLAIANIAGRGQAFHSFSIGAGTTGLWIIPRGKKNKQEVITELQAAPSIRSVSVVALTNPVQKNELTEVRELFTQFGWDTTEVTDEALSLFINAKLQRQYTYFIDHQHIERNPHKIQIKPVEEHPSFSPDWLKATDYNEEQDQGRELTLDDLEIRSVVIGKIEIDEPPTPPPPRNKK